MTPTELKRRTITLTNQAPVKITDDHWPLIAGGSWKDWDNQYECQANRTWKIDIHVRQHADGRAIVYGVYHYTTCFQGDSGESYRVGSLLAAPADLLAGIHDTAHQMVDRVQDSTLHHHIRTVADECIADLPAQEI